MDIITYALLKKKLEKKADLDSPHFIGEPTAPTADPGTNTDQIATTAFVQDAVEDLGNTKYTLDREGKFIVLSGTDDTKTRAELPYFCKTTAEWDADPSIISEEGAMYIYTDYRLNDDNQYVPGIKIGDGNAHVVDLPFQDEDILTHIINTQIHITQEEREFWNNKVTCYINAESPNTLIFTKENIINID